MSKDGSRTPEQRRFPKRVHVKVTTKHIARGRVGGYPDSCAVALAIKDRFPKHDLRVSVMTMNAFIGDVRYKLPDDATKFIRHFDSGGRCEPIQFYMEQP